MPCQLVERAGPTTLVAAARGFSAQSRMRESELGANADRAQIDLDLRHGAGLLGRAARRPLPTHDDAPRRVELEEFARTLLLAAVEHPETNPEATADASLGLGMQHRAGVRPPPVTDALGSGDRLEHDLRPCRDAPHQREARHVGFSRAFASPASASRALASRASA